MKSERNGYISLLKLYASLCVVFIHIGFGGIFGKALNSMSRFALSFFFCVSGYYAYRVDMTIMKKRLRKVIGMAVAAIAIYLLWECVYRYAIVHKSVRAYVAELLTIKSISKLVFMGVIPSAYHLWYLWALIMVYILFILYSRFWKSQGDIDYTPLYIIAFCGLMFNIAFSLKFKGADLETAGRVYRNSLFFGLPLFSLGLFLREYRVRIIENYGFSIGKSIPMILIGLALTLLQRFGIGTATLPVGILLVVVNVMLLSMTLPRKSPQSRIKRTVFAYAESCSAIIYLFHILVDKVITAYAKGVPLFAAIKSHNKLYPLFVAAVSLALGICVTMIKSLYNHMRLLTTGGQR